MISRFSLVFGCLAFTQASAEPYCSDTESSLSLDIIKNPWVAWDSDFGVVFLGVTLSEEVIATYIKENVEITELNYIYQPTEARINCKGLQVTMQELQFGRKLMGAKKIQECMNFYISPSESNASVRRWARLLKHGPRSGYIERGPCGGALKKIDVTWVEPIDDEKFATYLVKAPKTAGGGLSLEAVSLILDRFKKAKLGVEIYQYTDRSNIWPNER